MEINIPVETLCQSNSSGEMITYFVREVFGTYFIEPEKWYFPPDKKPIGRTFFSDRRSQRKAINDKTLENLLFVYKLALDGDSEYEPMLISRNISESIKKNFRLNVDYLMFYEDDNEQLRQQKAFQLRNLVFLIAAKVKAVEKYTMALFDELPLIEKHKIAASIAAYSLGTYTDIVIKNIHLTDPK